MKYTLNREGREQRILHLHLGEPNPWSGLPDADLDPPYREMTHFFRSDPPNATSVEFTALEMLSIAQGLKDDPDMWISHIEAIASRMRIPKTYAIFDPSEEVTP